MSAPNVVPEHLWLWRVTDREKRTWWVLSKLGALSPTRPWDQGYTFDVGLEVRRHHSLFVIWSGQRGRAYRVAVPPGWSTFDFDVTFPTTFGTEAFRTWLETDPLRQPVMSDLDALLDVEAGETELDALLEEDDDPLGLGSFG